MAETPSRNIRIDDERWEALRVLAEAEGRDRSGMVRRLIDERVAVMQPPPQPRHPGTK